MNEPKQVDSEANQLCQDDHLYRSWQVKYHEADVEDKRIKRQDGAIGSHLPLSKAHHHPKERVELNYDQEYYWLW